MSTYGQTQMSIEQALLRNAIGSPFVAPNPDGTESAVDECMLFYVRQHRAPILSSHFDAMASIFHRAFGTEKNETWIDGFQMHCERYLARIELLGKLLTTEAGLRQLVHIHLATRLPQSEIDELRREKKNLTESMLTLIQRLVNDEPTVSSFPLASFNSLIDQLRSFFAAPLVIFRNGVCHGNIRDFVRDIRKPNPIVGVVSEKSADGRAIQIYENLDAVSYYFLAKNLNLMHHVTYTWLVDFEPGNLLAKISEEACFEHRLYSEQGHSITCHRELALVQQLPNISNIQLREACEIPVQAWLEFTAECFHNSKQLQS